LFAYMMHLPQKDRLTLVQGRLDYGTEAWSGYVPSVAVNQL
jgi:hypothetical protein